MRLGPGGHGAARGRLPNVTWHVSPPLTRAGLRWTPFRRFAGFGQAWSDRRLGRFAAGGRVRCDPISATRSRRWGSRPCGGRTPTACTASSRVRTATCGRSATCTSPSPRDCVTAVFSDTRRPRWWRAWRGNWRWPIASGCRRLGPERHSWLGVSTRSDRTLQQPVDLEAFPPLPMPARELAPLRVCFVGSLDLRKGFVYLCRRCGAARRTSRCGWRDRRSVLPATARARTARSRRPVAPGRSAPRACRAEVFVLPTLEDGSPFAVAEAMASARPVITTTSTGAAEWVRPFETGWVVPPANDEALAGALRHAMDARARLGRWARRRVQIRSVAPATAARTLSRSGCARAEFGGDGPAPCAPVSRRTRSIGRPGSREPRAATLVLVGTAAPRSARGRAGTPRRDAGSGPGSSLTPPVATAAHTRDAAYELHLVCCFADYLAAIWALKSYLGLVGGGECHLHLHLQGLAPPAHAGTAAAPFSGCASSRSSATRTTYRAAAR